MNKVPGCETIEEDQILNWSEADNSKLGLTDWEIVDMVTEPATPKAEMTHGDFSRVTADKAFNAIEVRSFPAHSNIIGRFKLSNLSFN